MILDIVMIIQQEGNDKRYNEDEELYKERERNRETQGGERAGGSHYPRFS